MSASRDPWRLARPTRPFVRFVASLLFAAATVVCQPVFAQPEPGGWHGAGWGMTMPQALSILHGHKKDPVTVELRGPVNIVTGAPASMVFIGFQKGKLNSFSFYPLEDRFHVVNGMKVFTRAELNALIEYVTQKYGPGTKEQYGMWDARRWSLPNTSIFITDNCVTISVK